MPNGTETEDGLPILKAAPVASSSASTTEDGLPILKKKDGGEPASTGSANSGTGSSSPSPAPSSSPQQNKPKYVVHSDGTTTPLKVGGYDYSIPSIQQGIDQQNHTQNASGNTSVAPKYSVPQASDIEAKKQRAASLKADADKAVANTVPKILAQKGITGTDAQEGGAAYTQTAFDLQNKIKSGEVAIGYGKDGQLGLKQKGGDFLSSFSKAHEDAREEALNADLFTNSSTNEERIALMKMKQDKENADPYIGTKNDFGSTIGKLVGGAAQGLEKFGTGSVLGGAAIAAAPETAGASLEGLPTALGVAMGSKDAFNIGYQSEVERAFNAIKKNNPNISDKEAMDAAEKQGVIGGTIGLATNAALMGGGTEGGGTILKDAISDGAKNVIGDALKGTAKMAALPAAGQAATEEIGNLNGVKTSQADVLNDAVETFKNNLTPAVLLHLIGAGATGLTELPEKVQNTLKLAATELPTEQIKSTLEGGENTGFYSKGTADLVMHDINNFKEAADKIPTDIPDAKKADIAPLIQDKQALVEEQKTKDSSFKDAYQEKIDAVDNKIKDIIAKPTEEEANNNSSQLNTTDNGQSNQEANASSEGRQEVNQSEEAVEPEKETASSIEDKDLNLQDKNKDNESEIEKQLPDTLSPTEKRGAIAGGEENATATVITGKVHSANEAAKERGEGLSQLNLKSSDAKKVYREVNKIDEPTDARSAALSYIAGGGKIHPDSINEITGKEERAKLNTGDKDKKSNEVKDRDYTDKNAPSIDEVTHKIWDNLPEHLQDKISTEDIKNELQDVISSHNKRLDVANEYVDKYSIGNNLTDKEKEHYKNALPDEEDRLTKYLNDESGKEYDSEEHLPTEEEFNQINNDYESSRNESEDQQPTARPKKENDNGNSEARGTIENKAAEEENPSEAEDDKPKTVGVSHDALTKLANKLGLKEPERGTRLTNEEQADRGRQLLNAGADVEKLEKNFKGGKQPTADDISVARAHLEDLHKISDAMKDKWGIDSKQFTDANKEIERFNNEVMKPMGSKTSDPFAALQGERDINTGSFTSVKRAVEENKGSSASKEQLAKINELTKENEDLKQKSKEAEAKLIEQTDKDINEGQPTKNKGAKKKTTEDFKKERQSIVQKMRADLLKVAKGGGGLSMDIPFRQQLAAIAPHIATLVKSYIEEGIDNFKDIVEKIHDEFKGDIYGLRKRDVIDLIAGDYGKKTDKVTNPDTDIFIDIKRQATLTKKLQDLQNDLPEDFDKNKKEQSPEVKKLLEQIDKVRNDIDEYKGNPERRRVATLEKKLEDLRNGTEKEPTPQREKSGKEKQLLEQIDQEKTNQNLKKLQTMFADKKDNKFTPDQAKGLWDYAKKQYLDKGVSYNDMIKKVALDTGLKFDQVAHAITSPKLEAMSNEMYAKQAALRRSNMKVTDYIESHSKNNPISKFFKTLAKIPKGITTALHGHIFAGTHYPMGFLTPSQWGLHFKAIGKAWSTAYGSEANYEKEIQALTGDKNYVIAKRAGLQNDVDNTNIDEFEKDGKVLGVLGKVGATLGKTGTKGFLGMKWERQAMFNDYWDKLKPEDKTEESAKSIAALCNLATGASNLKIPKALQEGMFAAGMESARWGRLFKSPAQALEKSTGILTDMYKGNPIKPEDKVFVKVWGSRVGQQLATMAAFLGANAFVQSKINPKNPVNLTDPTKSDFLKFKIDNTDVDLSGGTLGVKQFLTSIASYAINDKSNEKEKADIGGKSLSYLRGKLSPLYGDATEVALGTDYAGNVEPWSKMKPGQYNTKLSWGEYLSTKAPIFIADGIKNLYDNAEQNGLSRNKTDKIINGIIESSITTGTGVRTSPSYK